MKTLCRLAAALGVVLGCHLADWTASATAQTIADYSFDGDLSSSTGQVDLEATYHPDIAAAGVTFTTATIGADTADVAELTDGTALIVRHGAPANGGGSYVNDYTLIMDVMFPEHQAADSWISLYQTNDCDGGAGPIPLSCSNDGDWFINANNSGIGISGNYGGGPLTAGTWYRFALTLEAATGNYTSYIDGAQVQQNAGAAGLDGRFALYGPDNLATDGYDFFLLFADDSGTSEMGAVTINHFQFRDVALSGDDIAALGGPSASGIPTGTEPGDVGDDCAGAVLVDVPSVTNASTVGLSPTNTGICGSNDSPSAWVKVMGTGRDITVESCGSSFDSRLSVYDGTCAALVCVGDNDDSCGTQSRVHFSSVAGTEYFISVHGFGTTDEGDVVLTIHDSPVPANDLCDDAELIDLSVSGLANGTTRGALADTESPDCGTIRAPGVWYTVDGTGGEMTASVCNAAAFDSRLSVFSGSCGGLTCVVENDDTDGCSNNTSFVSWNSTFGETYLILVHGFDALPGRYHVGDFALTVTGEPRPCMEITSCRANQVDKTVSLSWETVASGHTGIDVLLNGATVASLGPAETSYVSTPTLPEGMPFMVLDYTVAATGLEVDCSASCQAVLSTGNVCLADDFEDYANDSDLEVAGGWFRFNVDVPEEGSSWTLTNPLGRANPPTVNGVPSLGQFLTSDNDAGGGEPAPGSGVSWDILSPPFSTMGKDQVWLHMDTTAVLNNNGKAVFDVDVSTDGGATWENVFRRVAPSRVEAEPLADTTNSDGFFGRLDVDLSSAANQPEVRFRLRHFEPNFDWWIAVDNVVVDDQPPVGGGDISLVPTESFDGGIPGSWSVVSLVDPPNSGIDTWNTSDPCGREVVTFPHQDGRGAHRLAAPFAIQDSDCNPDPAEDEYLITPVVDCSALSEVFLHWKSETVLNGGATQEVLVSLDGGATFEATPIFSYSLGAGFDGGEDPMYAERVMKVPAAAGQSSVAFAFHYLSGGDQWWWGVDDIAISGNLADGVKINLQRQGDCNQDGRVDISDVVCNVFVLLPGFLLAGSGPTAACTDDLGNLAVLDVNGDMMFNVADIVYLARGLFSGGPPPVRGEACFFLDAALGCPDNPSCQ